MTAAETILHGFRMSAELQTDKKTRQKLKRYLADDRYYKLKSYVKKHKLDVVRIRLDNNDSALHVACAAGQKKIIRF